MKKVIWYVLHNIPKIDTYLAEFERKFQYSDMKQELPRWFEPRTLISVNSYVVNSVTFVVRSRDERHTTQKNGICSPGEKEGEMYFGQLEEIFEFASISFKVVLFRVKWNVIVTDDDYEVIHDNNSSNLALTASLNDLDFATLNIDAPVARGHSGDGAGDPPYPPSRVGGQKAGGGVTGEATRMEEGRGSDIEKYNKAHIKGRLMEEMIKLGDLRADTPTGVPYIEEKILAMPHAYSPNEIDDMIAERDQQSKAQKSHMSSERWTEIEKGIEKHFAKRYYDKKHNLKHDYWNVKHDETRDVKSIRSRPPQNVKQSD
nr:hypothetical protein [Tanacetum cinerariifolium]